MSINKAILLGNVGKTPEVHHLDNGTAVANFTLATSERAYKTANGTEVPEKTEWHNIVAWRGLADIIEKYVKKGSQLYVEGKISTRKWEKDGVTHYATEIIAESLNLLGKKTDDESPRQEKNEPSRAAQKPDFAGQPQQDDLPF